MNVTGIFKRLSIQKLLQLWVIACGIIILVLMILLTILNKSITTNHENLLNIAIPAENVSRELISTAANFIKRQNNILAANTSVDLNYFREPHLLTKSFDKELVRLAKLAGDNAKLSLLVDLIVKDYEQLLEYDELVTNGRYRILKEQEYLESKIIILESMVAEIIETIEQVHGQVNLDYSRSKKN